MNTKELNKIRKDNLLNFSKSCMLFNLTKKERITIQRIINRELKSIQLEGEKE